MRLIRRDGALTIRDIDDDVLVEKEHLWASRKPSKRALQLAFYTGELTISERNGMLKTYELMHAAFRLGQAAEGRLAARDHRLPARPRPARARARQPGFDLPSRRAEQAGGPPPDRGAGAPPRIGAGRARRRRQAGALGAAGDAGNGRRGGFGPRAHPLAVRSPDHPAQADASLLRLRTPLRGLCAEGKAACSAISRCRFWPASDIVAALDLKTDRQKKKLLLQKWNWVGAGKQKGARKELKRRIEEELHRFERFQLGE